MHLLAKFIDLKGRLLSSIIIFIFALIFFQANLLISSLFILVIYGILLFEWHNCTKKNKKTIDAIVFLYITLGIVAFLSVNYIRYIDFLGANRAYIPILLVIIVTVITDTSAYFIGRILGGRHLFPTISPNKTISGYVGGLVCGSLSPFILFYFMSNTSLSFNQAIQLPFIGMLLSFSALGGDLLESYFKRINKVKDTSNFIPGHGGFFDRLDALLGVSITLLVILITSYFIF